MKKTLKMPGIVLLTAIIGLFVGGCDDQSTDSTVSVTGVSLSETSLSLTVGASETLSAIIQPENATNKNKSWTSLNPGIATVDSTGKVAGKAAGTTSIIVTTEDGGRAAGCTVMVTLPALTGIVSISGTPAVGRTLTAVTPFLDGTGTISYQWKRGDTDIGTNSDTYIVQEVDVGSTITVTVTRSGNSGSVSSAAMTVNEKVNAQTPVITGHPASATVTINTSHTLSVTVSVTDGGELTYQWYNNTGNSNSGGAVITGATSDNYNPPTSMIVNTYYFVEVTNTIANNGDGGNKTASVRSNAVTLTVNEKVNAQTPNITSQPVGGTVIFGNTRTLSVTASWGDSGTLSYQWYSNTSNSNSGGAIISGATSANYNPPTNAAGTYYYFVEITNTIADNGDGGDKTASVRSNAVTLTVNNQTPVASDFYIDNLTQTAGSVTAVMITPKAGKSNGAITIYYNGSNALPTVAGTYTVTFNVAAATGWNAVTGLAGGTLTINQNPVAGDFDIGNLIQTMGSVMAATITPKAGKSTGAITIYYNGSTALPTAAGTYTVTFDVAAVSGWNAANGLSGGTLTVNKKPITITGVTATNRAYNGTMSVALTGGSLQGVVDGDTVGFTLGNGAITSAAASTSPKAVSANITLTGANAGNYTLTQPTGITVTISKATGAAVPAPVVNGTPTTSSITVNAITGVTQPDGSAAAIQYAISTASNGTGLSAWQNATTFSGLNGGTTYYVYARSVESTNYNAGSQSVSAGIATAQAASFNISFADFSDINEPTMSAGIIYLIGGTGRPSSATITVGNPSQYETGSIKWYLNNNLIGAGESLTVNSNTYNNIGNYSVTVEVKKDGKLYSKIVTFEVRP